MEPARKVGTIPSALSSPTALYHAVRGAFITQGTTLNQWCLLNGIHRQEVRRALLGLRASAHYATLRRKVMAAAGLTE